MTFGAAEENAQFAWRDMQRAVRVAENSALFNAQRADKLEQRFPCDADCRDSPEEDCSRHGRTPKELWDLLLVANSKVIAHEALIERLTQIHTRRDDGPYILGPTCRRCNQSWPCATASVLGITT